MARCELTIELDNNRSTFRPGEAVSGQVVVSTDEAVRCDGLVVELAWATVGGALGSRGTPQELVLFQGELSPVSAQRFPFTFRMPAGLPSYHGHNVELRWFLEARADIPWAIDPVAQAVVDLEPDPELDPDWWALFEHERFAPVFLHRAREEDTDSDSEEEADGFTTSRKFGIVDIGCLGLATLFVVLAGWSLLNTMLALFDGVTSWAEEWSGMAFEVGLFAVSLLVAAWFIRSRIASWRLGKLRLEIEPRLLRPGQTVAIRVHGTPARDLELEGATCHLQATERSEAEKEAHERLSQIDNKKRRTRTLHHLIHNEQVEIFPAQTLRAKLPFQLQGDLKIPTDVPSTFATKSARLDWKVKLTLRVKGWPSWEAQRTIVVHP